MIKASLAGQTKASPTFQVFPLHYTFTDPQLQSPGNGAAFRNRIAIKFTWSDDGNAYFHHLQISDSPSFNSTYLDEVLADDPIWAQSYFNGVGIKYWRVRYLDGSGAAGPWSQTGSFEITPQ